ncbi:MAG: hypothetical protein OXC37_00195 [Bdellovibrionaceae bacterium]|nr:hypothetical protein [Pseudobdellovibrionaceae bacterium]
MDIEKTKSWIYKQLSTKKVKFPSENLEEEDIKDLTCDFLQELKAIVQHYIQAYDKIKSDESYSTKSLKEKLNNSFFIYDLADTLGFMVFKKHYKLIFAYIKPGQIRIKFLKQKPLSEIEVFVDTYLNAVSKDTMSIRWVHDNKKGFIDKEILVRYYMKRFLEEI